MRRFNPSIVKKTEYMTEDRAKGGEQDILHDLASRR